MAAICDPELFPGDTHRLVEGHHVPLKGFQLDQKFFDAVVVTEATDIFVEQD